MSNDAICEECIEYVCEHMYPCLKLEDCNVCMEPLTQQSVRYFNDCRHALCRTCLLTANAYREVHENAKMMDTVRLERYVAGSSACIEDRDAFKAYENCVIGDILRKRLLNDGYVCPYCTLKSKKLLTYDELHIECCNSVMPRIASVCAETYHAAFRHHKHRLRPTTEMLEYIRLSKELFGEHLQVLSHWKPSEDSGKLLYRTRRYNT
jgi:hypothetical protein